MYTILFACYHIPLVPNCFLAAVYFFSLLSIYTKFTAPLIIVIIIFFFQTVPDSMEHVDKDLEAV